MNSETFLHIFGDIDEEYIEQAADEDGNYIGETCEGVAVRVDVPRRSFRRTVIAAVGGIAAVFGVFVLLLNVVKSGAFIFPDNSYSGSGQSDIIDNPTTPEIENPSQIFTKNFDGLVLTVTTDKTTYNTGDQINLTATLENNTGKDIYLYYGDSGAYGYNGSKAGESAELMPRFEHLVEYPIRRAVWFDCAVTMIPFRQGEKCVQDFTFRTYTDYIYFGSLTGQYKDSVVPDPGKAAEPGEHNGKLVIMTCSDREGNDFQEYTLDFSVTIAPQNSDNENPKQVFTKDYDGLVLTVTTDKSTYNIGDPIILTAELENKTGNDINLLYGGATTGNTVELMPRFEHLVEYPIHGDITRVDVMTVIPFKSGEKCVQTFAFQTYTGYIEGMSATGGVAFSPDPNKSAEPGVYNGSLRIHTCTETNYPYGDEFDYTLDFSVTVAPQSSDNANPSRTFSKDFDGIILTVTTGKSAYNPGETVNVNATLENRSGKDIYLRYGHIPHTNEELGVKAEGLIKDPIVLSDSHASAVHIITVKNGEKLENSLKYLTYTGIVREISEDGKLIGSPDPDKIAEPGVYNGSCEIFVCDEPDYPHGNITDYSLGFSIVLK